MAFMIGRDSLFEPAAHWAAVPQGLPLVALLDGYRDAGHTVALSVETMLADDGGQLVAVFDTDSLLDYRARRPLVKVEGNHINDFRSARLDLRLLRDSIGQPFLLLSGFEPDFRWEAFTRALNEITTHFAVSSVTWAHSIPMPVPHTRPIRVAATGNREEIIEQLSVWKAHVEAPAHALHLLEYQRMQQELDVVSIVVLTPHYLADGAYPAAAMRLLEALGTVDGILVPTESLRERDREFRATFEETLAENDEAVKLVEVLEQQYDGFLKGTPLENPFANADGELPDADKIAAELERYLKSRSDGTN